MKKLISLALALVMILSLSVTAFAQDVGTVATGKGTITISNAAKGETYAIYKLFDATVNADGSSIAYTGNIPEGLATYFTKDEQGNISATAAAKDGDNMSAGLKTALKTWAGKQTATASVESDGSKLNFNGLDYGYYVVTTTQGEQLISVDSTMPNATIVDKNTTVPKNLVKNVDNDNVKIGDTVTYTVEFLTANYNGEKAIVSYTIHDDLPQFLSNPTVTSITVDGVAIDLQQFVEKKIVIDWYDEANKAHLYKNGAKVVITYTAVVTDKAAIDGAGNTNTVTLTWNDIHGEEYRELKDTAVIYTYALALKKVNNKGNALAGATFQFPFFVKETRDTDGAYIYAGTDSGAGLTNTITTPDDGVIIVKGLKSGEKVTITETEAPAGYNKLTAPVEVTPTKTGSTTTNVTFYLDDNGNITATQTQTIVKVESDDIAATAIAVVNKAGTELPSTGGMGTTLFYVLGGLMVLGAVVVLVTKKRMGAAE